VTGDREVEGGFVASESSNCKLPGAFNSCFAAVTAERHPDITIVIQIPFMRAVCNHRCGHANFEDDDDDDVGEDE
jgi:hypothetical protein